MVVMIVGWVCKVWFKYKGVKKCAVFLITPRGEACLIPRVYGFL